MEALKSDIDLGSFQIIFPTLEVHYITEDSELILDNSAENVGLDGKVISIRMGVPPVQVEVSQEFELIELVVPFEGCHLHGFSQGNSFRIGFGDLHFVQNFIHGNIVSSVVFEHLLRELGAGGSYGPLVTLS